MSVPKSTKKDFRGRPQILVENFLGIDKTSYFLLLENNVNSATIQLEKQKKGLG